MNKKIWIGLISVFLVVALVLGIQMMKEKNNADTEDNIARESNSGDENELVVVTPEIEEEAEIEEEDAELPEESEEPVEEAPNEEPKESETVEKPVEPSKTDKEASKTEEPKATEDNKLYVTLSVSVKTLLDKKDKMKPEKWDLVPKDGWIFAEQKVEFNEGESAFNVLLREMKKNKIHMEFIMTPLYNSNYIQGIGNLYEFDCGELSGWMYSVNDSSPNFGTSNYTLKDGDVVKLQYTCDLGRDLGFDYNE